MAFSFGYSPWLLVLSTVLAAGLTYWSYRSTIPAIAPGWRWLLGSLRFTSLFLVCFLLLEPVVRQLSESEDPPILAVLIDDSKSMRVVSGRADTSAAAVRERLRPVLSSLRENTPGTLRFFAFDQSTRPLPDNPLDSLRFDGARSNIGAAIEAISEQLQGENLRAVAVLSDGQYNTGQTPVRVADRSALPVHTVTVGDTSHQRDLQVRRLATNDIAYVDTEVPIQVTLATKDLGNERTTISLRQGNAVVAETTTSLPSGTAEKTVDLSYRPTSPGLKQLTVQASAVPGEATTRNNVRSVSQRVLESKRQVLLLGAAPSPSFASIRRALSGDANTSITARVPKKDGSFYGGAFPDSLSSFDVIVSAGFPGPSVDPDVIDRVASVLEDGTPALFLLDRQTNVRAWTDHFDSVLPARPPDTNADFTEASATLGPATRNHPVFELEGADLRLFERLPPLLVPSTGWSPSPDATVLLGATRPALSETDPLLVVRRRAGDRSALFLGTGTWRWGTLPADLEAADRLWPGLLSNLLRWVSTKDDEQQVRVQPVTPTFDGDEAVEFAGQVYDESMTPASDASVSVTITDSAGTTYPHSMEPLGNGRYSLSVGTLPEGTYQFDAVATQAEAEMGRDQGQFSVGPLRIEYQNTRANPVLMRRLATRSGGTAHTVDTAEELPGVLSNDESFSSRVVTQSTEAELWRTTILLLVILSLLAAEWTLRKRFGLT